MKRLLASPACPVAFLLLLTPAHTAPQWKQLKVGMSSTETLKHLGEPLIKSKARGFERWIYDGSGEVFFSGGPVKYWTVAHPTPASEAKPVESDVLFRPARPLRSPYSAQQVPAFSPPPAAIDGPRFRYR